MFQTELVLFLQSLENDFLNSFFLFWTEVGYSRWTTPLMLVILFGVSFRAGFIMMQAMIWNGMTTLFFKDIFSLPRPCDVDVNVKLIGRDVPNVSLFDSMGAKTFFGRIPQDVVSALRQNPISTWGFPSGHTSNATTLGGLLFLVYRKTWVRLIAVAMVVFIPLSRMYLGRHFLADLLGGYALGAIFVLIFYVCVFKNDWIEKNLFNTTIRNPWEWKHILCLFYLVGLPFLLVFIPHINISVAATFLGLNVGFLLVWIRGMPEDRGTVIQRLARVVTALGVFFATDFVLKKIIGALCSFENELAGFIRIVLTAVLFLWGTTEVCVKLGFYRRQGSHLKIKDLL